MKGRADRTEPSLGFMTVLMKLHLLVLLSLPKLVLLLIPTQMTRSINTGTKLLAPPAFFPLAIEVNPVHHPREVFFSIPQGGAAAAPLCVPSVQPEKG